jgi:hypothetical protein
MVNIMGPYFTKLLSFYNYRPVEEIIQWSHILKGYMNLLER